MHSNALTVQNQGGGEKKAGFPYIVGRTSWTNIYFGQKPQTGNCCKKSSLARTLIFTRNTVRPVGNDSRIPMR
jgi:hypothetical protein